jgi:hypothetical protein
MDGEYNETLYLMLRIIFHKNLIFYLFHWFFPSINVAKRYSCFKLIAQNTIGFLFFILVEKNNDKKTKQTLMESVPPNTSTNFEEHFALIKRTVNQIFCSIILIRRQ